jgi:hypothetical protein
MFDLGIPIAFQAVVLLQQYKGQMIFPVEKRKKAHYPAIISHLNEKIYCNFALILSCAFGENEKEEYTC